MSTTQADELERSAVKFEADGYFLKCVAVLKQALKLDPSRRRIHLKLAELHLRLGLHDEAATALSASKWRLEDEDEAARYLAVTTALVEERPDDAALSLDRAYALSVVGRVEDASAEISRGIPLLRRDFPELTLQALAARANVPDDLHALRVLLSQRTTAETASQQLDFKRPN